MLLYFLFCTILAIAFAAPTEHVSSSVLHEKRHVRSALRRGARVDGSSITSFRIALKQRNLEHADDYLMSVSHPSSPKYGQLWTAEDVRHTFAPSDEAVNVVRRWLANAGIDKVEVRRGWLVFETSISRAEALMGSQYHEHEDHEIGAIRMGCDE